MGPGPQIWEHPAKLAERPPSGLPEGAPRRPKGDRVEVVEYRDAKRGYTARLVLRVRAGGPPQADAGDVRNLHVKRPDDSGIYQLIFNRGPEQPNEMAPGLSTTHCHEFPIVGVVRCEEEWAPGVDSGLFYE